jgi:hypothetical protein
MGDRQPHDAAVREALAQQHAIRTEITALFGTAPHAAERLRAIVAHTWRTERTLLKTLVGARPP